MPVRLVLPSARLGSALAVLGELRNTSSATAGELVDVTGLSRPTVLAACDDLISAGWVSELSADRPTGPGRPARTFSLDVGAALVAGVDLGWGSVNAVIVDLQGNELGRSGGRLRHDASAATRLAAIQKHVTLACGRADVSLDRLAAVVVGIAAPVLGDEIHAAKDYLRDLHKFNLRDRLAVWLPGATVLLENDANLAAVAERASGPAAGERNVVALLAGERLGAGVIADGRLLRGARGAAGEIGAAAFLFGATAEGAGYAVRTAATAAIRERPERHTALIEKAGAAGELDASGVFEVAATDQQTHRLVVRALRPVAKAIAVIHLLLDPEIIVIGGAVASADGLIPALLEAMPQHTELQNRPVRLAASELGAQAVLAGAITLAQDIVWEELGLSSAAPASS